MADRCRRSTRVGADIIAGVVPRSAESVMQLTGRCNKLLVAAIGPCIGAEHFEVGPEVVEAFDSAGLGSVVMRDGYAKPHIDLAAAVAHQLQQAGVSAEHIDRTDRCTYAREDEFFSHRRDHGRTGRQAALIAVRPG
ncbi:MAG: laccase domain-containing protein [Phycisphaerales bacterium]